MAETFGTADVSDIELDARTAGGDAVQDYAVTHNAPDLLDLEEADYSTDVDGVLLNCLDKRARKRKLVPWVVHSPTREIYLERKKKAIDRAGVSERTFEYWIEEFKREKDAALTREGRADKGKHRINTDEFDWVDFIRKEWRTRTEAGQIISVKDIYGLVQSKALIDLKVGKYPSESTIRRVLKPLQTEKELAEGTGSAGQGARSVVYTNDGKQLKAEFSNCLVQADDTELDVMSIDEDDEPLGRPWLTLIVDVFSTCVLGFFLSIKRPTSEEVALAIRHAILPKKYPAEYGIQAEFPYGKFFAWHTDKGSNLNCDHIISIGERIGFECYIRAEPKEGGNVERPFGTINTQVNSKLKGYVGSHTKKRPENAEEEACLTLRDIRRILARYFCDEYNQDICPKDRRMTRYQKWLSRLPGGKPRTIEERKLDICLLKQEHCKVYHGGVVRFLNQRYQGECLRDYKGWVTLLYDADRILRMRAYSWTGDGRLGKFLGYVNMINTEELGIDESQVESGDFSLDDLKAILAAINVDKNAAEKSTERIRAAARKDRYDFADEKAKDKKERQRQEQDKLRREAKGIEQPAEDLTQSENSSQEAKKPKSSNVINLQQQRRKRSIEAFDELLKSDTTAQQPRVIIPKQKDRFW